MIEVTRIGAQFCRWDELLSLVRSSFAYMDGVINPPSSALLLTVATLAEKAQTEIGFAALDEDALVGCIFCRPESGFLYIGKLAVAPGHQKKGIGQRLLAVAEQVARERGLPALRLETRIELTGNHATFARWGFQRTGENSHAGFTGVTSIEMTKPLA